MNELAPTGLIGLRETLGLKVPGPYVRSFRNAPRRRTVAEPSERREYYRSPYGGDGSPRAMLRFALRYEPLDLGVLVPALRALGDTVREWVLDEPASSFARRAWFLYERFVGEGLDLPDAFRSTPAASALNDKLQLALPNAASEVSSRHRVRDNLLGGAGFCPMVRLTDAVAQVDGRALRSEIADTAHAVDPEALERAVRWLHTEETRSTFEIEGDQAHGSRAQRFFAALQGRSKLSLPADEASLVALQRAFVDARYASTGWRQEQVFVGGGTLLDEVQVSYVCPKPEDLPRLMEGWRCTTERALRPGAVDPIFAAALVAFGFVFIHPFEDGNGRIHRLLLHRVFDALELTDGLLLPVSAVILKRLTEYHQSLRAVSQPLMDFVDWDRLPRDGGWSMEVRNDTVDLYRFLDMTPVVEFTWEVVAETVRAELPRELRWVGTYDRALRGVQDHLDLPDREASLFVRLRLQNEGSLSARKRERFKRLTDAEVSTLEAIVRRAMSAP